MNAKWFQRELGVIPIGLLHGPSKALVLAWNKGIGLCHSPLVYGGVELREMKKEKRHLECHWRSTRNEFNRMWVRVDIKAFVTVRMAKPQYFSMLIVWPS